MSPRGPPGRAVTAAESLAPLLAQSAAELHKHEGALHADLAAVHEYRIALRRLRSVVAGYRPLFDRSAARQIDLDLRAAAAAFGDARDSQVLSERTDALFPDRMHEPEARAVHAQIQRVLPEGDAASGRGFLESSEYDASARRLDRFCDLPPWSAKASFPAEVSLPPLIRREWKRSRAAGRRSLEPTAGDLDERLHDARKAAKRAQHVFEASVATFGRPPALMAKAARRIRRTLGDHRDTSLVQDLLARAIAEATLQGEDTRGLVRLQVQEEATATRLLGAYPALLEAAERRRLRRWLD